ncbi:protein transporter sec24 [Babesia caballi]|uniref:Protein transporter sec24 n=1 Tax=Babesia caballi TaxID=5871 RepID=A0AAV4LRN4_BABCB|nr:protein transporter sec24 [Babesia caballi]
MRQRVGLVAIQQPRSRSKRLQIQRVDVRQRRLVARLLYRAQRGRVAVDDPRAGPLQSLPLVRQTLEAPARVPHQRAYDGLVGRRTLTRIRCRRGDFGVVDHRGEVLREQVSRTEGVADVRLERHFVARVVQQFAQRVLSLFVFVFASHFFAAEDVGRVREQDLGDLDVVLPARYLGQIRVHGGGLRYPHGLRHVLGFSIRGRGGWCGRRGSLAVEGGHMQADGRVGIRMGSVI